MKADKSLEDYDDFVSAWLQSVNFKILSEQAV